MKNHERTEMERERERERERELIDTFVDISKCIFISTRLKERIDKCRGLVVNYKTTRWNKIFFHENLHLLFNCFCSSISFYKRKCESKNPVFYTYLNHDKMVTINFTRKMKTSLKGLLDIY